MRESIGIVGCGWLGEPLALELNKNYDVECFKRDSTWQDDSFWQRETIIIAINTKNNYLKTLKKIAELTKPSSKIILMSSTSIYREFDDDVDESAKISKPSLIKDAEDMIIGLRERVLIFRLGGLMGEDRVAGRWKSATDFSDGYVNYIHRDDVISIVKKALERGVERGIYNLVAPIHPTRKEIHEKNSQKYGSDIGNFQGFTKRRVLSGKMIKELNYTFLHPNPLEFWD
jgi:nucleoside-diphosphate-sugar epimerase